MRLLAGVSPHDHVLGPASAPALVVLYGDFECPYTKRAHRVVKELASWYGNLIGIVFRHFPLVERHPHAHRAAEAAEAAHSQGLFWEMQDCLFENQQLLDRRHLLRYAASLGLDVQRFAEDLDGGVHRHRVDRDTTDGVALGVSSPPGLFVNGKTVGGLDYDDAFELIEDALSSKAMFLVARS
jgi:protein-disulfide isomerase